MHLVLFRGEILAGIRDLSIPPAAVPPHYHDSAPVAPHLLMASAEGWRRRRRSAAELSAKPPWPRAGAGRLAAAGLRSVLEGHRTAKPTAMARMLELAFASPVQAGSDPGHQAAGRGASRPRRCSSTSFPFIRAGDQGFAPRCGGRWPRPTAARGAAWRPGCAWPDRQPYSPRRARWPASWRRCQCRPAWS